MMQTRVDTICSTTQNLHGEHVADCSARGVAQGMRCGETRASTVSSCSPRLRQHRMKLAEGAAEPDRGLGLALILLQAAFANCV